MSTLREYLGQKRAALLERRERAKGREPGFHEIKARATAEGRSGVRRIQIREHRILSDSPYDFAGYNLGPSSPELQLGVLSSCLTHVFLIQAADREIPLDSLEVEVTGVTDGRAGKEGFEHIPRYPHNLTYTVHVTSDATQEQLIELHKAVEAVCPILNLLINPQVVRGSILLNETERLPEHVSAAPALAAD